jgi:hypothetical protein
MPHCWNSPRGCARIDAMTLSSSPAAPNWTARLARALLLLLAGAGIAVWGLTRWDSGARFLGVAPAAAPAVQVARVVAPPVAAPVPPTVDEAERIATLEVRLATLERQTQITQGSAGRADALVIAFATRRAIERGVALGYLETLLVERFGAGHAAAVATIITASRTPATQAQLLADFDRIGGVLRGAGPDESWLIGARRELGSLLSIRRTDEPSVRPSARFDRARDRLESGEIDAALAETMRLPGAVRPEAQGWITRARQLIAVRRALDEVESAALVGPARPTI